MNTVQEMKSIKKSNIAGSVIVYNSDVEVITNIKTYLDQVDTLYIVDNSDRVNNVLVEWAKSESMVRYFYNGCNIGVANALNQAAEYAIKDGYSYLLTMDDDSKAPINMVTNMLSFLNAYNLKEQVGIISVQHSDSHKEYELFKKVIFTMTSGNLLNLSAYKKIGGFNGLFFIDHVDHDFGIRLNNFGFEVIEIIGLKLIHNLGVMKHILFFGQSVFFISHPPKRFFYFVRNGVYVIRQYYLVNVIVSVKILKLILKELLKSILFEKNKIIRCKYFTQAIIYGLKGKLGELKN